MGMELTRAIANKYTGYMKELIELNPVRFIRKKFIVESIKNYKELLRKTNVFKLMNIIIQDCIADNVEATSHGLEPTWYKKFTNANVQVLNINSRYTLFIELADVFGTNVELSYRYKSDEIEVVVRNDGGEGKDFSFNVINGRSLNGHKVTSLWNKILPLAIDELIEYL